MKIVPYVILASKHKRCQRILGFACSYSAAKVWHNGSMGKRETAVSLYLNDSFQTLEERLGHGEVMLMETTDLVVSAVGSLSRMADGMPLIREFAEDTVGNVFGDYDDETGVNVFLGGLSLACIWAMVLHGRSPHISPFSGHAAMGSDAYYEQLTGMADCFMLRSPKIWRCFEVASRRHCDISGERDRHAYLGFAAASAMMEKAAFTAELVEAYAAVDRKMFELRLGPILQEEQTLNQKFADIAGRILRGGEERVYEKLIVRAGIDAFLATVPGIAT